MTIPQFGIGMTFRGSEEPTASLEMSSLGLMEDLLPELSQSLCQFLEDTLNLDPKRIYIRLTSPERSHWGWNGKTFDAINEKSEVFLNDYIFRQPPNDSQVCDKISFLLGRRPR